MPRKYYKNEDLEIPIYYIVNIIDGYISEKENAVKQYKYNIWLNIIKNALTPHFDSDSESHISDVCNGISKICKDNCWEKKDIINGIIAFCGAKCNYREFDIEKSPLGKDALNHAPDMRYTYVILKIFYDKICGNNDQVRGGYGCDEENKK